MAIHRRGGSEVEDQSLLPRFTRAAMIEVPKNRLPERETLPVTKCDVFDVSRKLRERGWLVPAYTMPPKREDLAVLRVVVRNGFSRVMADLFLSDLRDAVEWLDDLDAPCRSSPTASTTSTGGSACVDGSPTPARQSWSRTCSTSRSTR